MSIITIGIDLAKNVFAVHGVHESSRVELVKPKVARDPLLPLIANLPPRLIGMAACRSAHHWARQFRQHGRTVRLIAPKFVTPYRMSGKRGKNDAADAAAIGKAVTRPDLRCVPVKDEHQQAILTLHRTRRGLVEERTARYNRRRGLIAEFGIVLPQKIGPHLEDLPGRAQPLGRQTGPIQLLGQKPGRASRLLTRGDRHRGKERAHGLGSAEVRRGLPPGFDGCLSRDEKTVYRKVTNHSWTPALR